MTTVAAVALVVSATVSILSHRAECLLFSGHLAISIHTNLNHNTDNRNFQACDWMYSMEGVNPEEAEMFGKV